MNDLILVYLYVFPFNIKKKYINIILKDPVILEVLK